VRLAFELMLANGAVGVLALVESIVSVQQLPS